MSRSLPEWIGRSDDSVPPPRVRARVFLQYNGVCAVCGVKIIARKWLLDHTIALINGGENRETNLRPVHDDCHKTKTAADVAEKSIISAKRNKWLGIKPQKSRPLPGTKASGWKKTFSRGWVRR